MPQANEENRYKAANQTGVNAMSNERVKTWGGIASVAILLLLIGIVGNMGYQDEVAEANTYCQKVAEGIWPDYNGTYDKECEDGHHYLVEK